MRWRIRFRYAESHFHEHLTFVDGRVIDDWIADDRVVHDRGHNVPKHADVNEPRRDHDRFAHHHDQRGAEQQLTRQDPDHSTPGERQQGRQPERSP